MRAMAFTHFGADLDATDLPAPDPGVAHALKARSMSVRSRASKERRHPQQDLLQHNVM